MKYLLVSFMVSACSQNIPVCPDMAIPGVCVNSNNYNLDVGMLDLALRVTNEETNELLYRSDVLSDIFDALQVNIEYIPSKSSKLYDKENNHYNLGLTNATKIWIAYPDSKYKTEALKCIEKYCTFSHELLHVFSTYVLKNNEVHDVPYVFRDWARRRGHNIKNTIEYRSCWRIRNVCVESGEFNGTR